MGRDYLKSVERVVGRLSVRSVDRLAKGLSPFADDRPRLHAFQQLMDVLRASVIGRVRFSELPERERGELRPYYPNLMRFRDGMVWPMLPISLTRSITFRPGPGGAASYVKGQLLYAHRLVLCDALTPLAELVAERQAHLDDLEPIVLSTLAWLRFLADCRELFLADAIRVIRLPLAHFRDPPRELPHPVDLATDVGAQLKKSASALTRGNNPVHASLSAQEMRFRARYLQECSIVREQNDVDYSMLAGTTATETRAFGLMLHNVGGLAGLRLKSMIELPGLAINDLPVDVLMDLREGPLFEEFRACLSRGLGRVQHELDRNDPDFSYLARELIQEDLAPLIRGIRQALKGVEFQAAGSAGLQRVLVTIAATAGTAATGQAVGLAAPVAAAAASGIATTAWLYLSALQRQGPLQATARVVEGIRESSDWYVPWDGSTPWPRSLWK